MPTKSDTTARKTGSDSAKAKRMVVAVSGGTIKVYVTSDLFHILSNFSGPNHMRPVESQATWGLYELDNSTIPYMVMMTQDSITFFDLC